MFPESTPSSMRFFSKTDVNTNEKVAIKIINKSSFRHQVKRHDILKRKKRKEQLDVLKTEMAIMLQLRHEHVTFFCVTK